MQGKIVLITGGNTGIGKATAIGLGKRGARVVFTARDPGKGEAAAHEIRAETGAEVTSMLLDLGSFASIEAFAADFRERFAELHVLVNNAGLILTERAETAEGFEATLGVNHLGHFLLTELVLDRLRASAPARIVVVSSAAHYRSRGLDFEDLGARRRYGSYRVYADSKLANLYFVSELARRLRGTGVTVNAVHPGVVASDFAADGDTQGLLRWFYRVAKPLLRTPEEGAETTLYVATAPELGEVTGEYFANCRRARPSRVARDDQAARRLWQVSADLVAAARDRHGSRHT
jgi:NAD(P)-dependent dehydrogenase (short-subunit alcohol dehydrogenase family)